jgi:tetratricopeptide (TPR) repeat protein
VATQVESGGERVTARDYADYRWDAEQAEKRGDPEEARRLYSLAADNLAARLEAVPEVKVKTHRLYGQHLTAFLYRAGRYAEAIEAGQRALRIAGPWERTEELVRLCEEATTG